MIKFLKMNANNDEVIFANDEQRLHLLGKVNMLKRELEKLGEQIRKSPTAKEVKMAEFEAERKNCWDTYPNISDGVDYALCGSPSTWQIRYLSYDPFFTILVKEAIAEFGEELEQEIENSLIRDEAGDIQSQIDMTDKHKGFLNWLENYPSETVK